MKKFSAIKFQVSVASLPNNDEIARVGVWKNAPGGPTGSGAARVLMNGSTVDVVAGEGMAGSFSVTCQLPSDAQVIAQVVRDTLDNDYKQIEVSGVATESTQNKS